MAAQMFLQYLSRFLVLILCIPVHEWAHGFAAYRLGDGTAKEQGRLTLNPLAHFDLLGTLSMVLIGIGWAKPVPVNPRNFKNPKAGMALTSVMGPLANLAMAFLLMILLKISFYLYMARPNEQWLYSAFLLLKSAANINIVLAVFNLLPVPPLDGSKILAIAIPNRIYQYILKYEQLGMLLLIVLMFTNVLQVPLEFLSHFIYQFLLAITSFTDVIMKSVIGGWS